MRTVEVASCESQRFDSPLPPSKLESEHVPAAALSTQATTLERREDGTMVETIQQGEARHKWAADRVAIVHGLEVFTPPCAE